MIVFLSDFGCCSPYAAQMEARAALLAPGVSRLTLFSDLPPFDARAAAFLLPAYVNEFPADTVFVCVVDPGVGTSRRAVVLRADDQWFVGPDNGVLGIVGRRAVAAKWWEITWRPENLSATFHGRDLFVPVGAALARGERPSMLELPGEEMARDWPRDDWRVLYFDRFGNAITGIRGGSIAENTRLRLKGRVLRQAGKFSDVGKGEPFWYVNSNGLVEVAVNRGSARESLGLVQGDEVGGFL